MNVPSSPGSSARLPFLSVQSTATSTIAFWVGGFGELRPELIVEAAVVRLDRGAAVANQIVRDAKARRDVERNRGHVGFPKTAFTDKCTGGTGLRGQIRIDTIHAHAVIDGGAANRPPILQEHAPRVQAMVRIDRRVRQNRLQRRASRSSRK